MRLFVLKQNCLEKSVLNNRGTRQSPTTIWNTKEFTRLFGLEWFDTLSFGLQATQFAVSTKNNQSEKKMMGLWHSKKQPNFRHNQTIKSVKVKIT